MPGKGNPHPQTYLPSPTLCHIISLQFAMSEDLAATSTSQPQQGLAGCHTQPKPPSDRIQLNGQHFSSLDDLFATCPGLRLRVLTIDDNDSWSAVLVTSNEDDVDYTHDLETLMGNGINVARFLLGLGENSNIPRTAKHLRLYFHKGFGCDTRLIYISVEATNVNVCFNILIAQRVLEDLFSGPPDGTIEYTLLPEGGNSFPSMKIFVVEPFLKLKELMATENLLGKLLEDFFLCLLELLQFTTVEHVYLKLHLRGKWPGEGTVLPEEYSPTKALTQYLPASPSLEEHAETLIRGIPTVEGLTLQVDHQWEEADTTELPMIVEKWFFDRNVEGGISRDFSRSHEPKRSLRKKQ
ncbi:hypothetical protein QCA50_007361 [Cerrena zonata]|uniref:Uncharacterized protein n=1 Tax=Cerrena zonata TaxID=2478898 RepID=A0AAW0GDW6_9APHY